MKEIPYTFGSRLHGESKLDSMVALDFLGLVLAKLTNDAVSLRFLLFARSDRPDSSCISPPCTPRLNFFVLASRRRRAWRVPGDDQQFHSE